MVAYRGAQNSHPCHKKRSKDGHLPEELGVVIKENANRTRRVVAIGAADVSGYDVGSAITVQISDCNRRHFVSSHE